MATGRIIIPNRTGHSTVEWDVADERSVEEAKREFEAIMTAGGMLVDTSPGKEKQQVRNFDPSVEEFTVLAPLVGG